VQHDTPSSIKIEPEKAKTAKLHKNKLKSGAAAAK